LHPARALLKANGLQHMKRHFQHSGLAVIASLLACVVLLLDAMAACPDLHELIHHDADEPGHECAVTMFAHGQVDSPVVDVAAIIPVAPVEFFPMTSVSVFNALVEELPPSCGPPV
jgi:hypothetical protein